MIKLSKPEDTSQWDCHGCPYLLFLVEISLLLRVHRVNGQFYENKVFFALLCQEIEVAISLQFFMLGKSPTESKDHSILKVKLRPTGGNDCTDLALSYRVEHAQERDQPTMDNRLNAEKEAVPFWHRRWISRLTAWSAAWRMKRK